MKINELIIIDGVPAEIYRDMTPKEKEIHEKRLIEGMPRTKTKIKEGEYFNENGIMYQSLTTIPAGDLIKPGTNCKKISNIREKLK